MSYLVTGGAGFIGSHLVDALLAKGHSVVALDDLSGGFRDNVSRAATFVEGSILDEALIRKLFEEHRFEYVFHLAAYAAEGLSHFIRRFNYENNLLGSMNLINASVNFGIKRFIFTSSIAVYGKAQVPMSEDMVPSPEDPYGIAKHAVERDLQAAHELFGLDYTIFRPHNVYGERQNIGDRYRNVVGIFMNQILQGKPLPIFGDGKQTRAFSHISEVMPMIVDSAHIEGAKNQVFNVGAEDAWSVLELAKLVCEVMNVPVRIEYLPARNEVVHAYASHQKAERVFGRATKRGLESGLRAMAQWALTHGARESARFKNIEVMKNLPPSWA